MAHKKEVSGDTVVLIVSGGFDPDHVGHVRLVRAAKALFPHNKTYLVAVLNNDEWLRRFKKNGLVVSKVEERKEKLEEWRSVAEVRVTKHAPGTDDRSICASLQELRDEFPNQRIVFCNGGDRTLTGGGEIPEAALCKLLDIEMVFGIGGGKADSSSQIVERIRAHNTTPGT
jgi:cytidyltransferase-like protein